MRYLFRRNPGASGAIHSGQAMDRNTVPCALQANQDNDLFNQKPEGRSSGFFIS
jgi:hypothetical protein